MNISYDYYRIFYYVAKYQSFTNAAKALMNNQPNITRTIKILENELGCKLFIRQKNGVILTLEGKKLYNHVSAAFEHIYAAELEIAEDRSLESGTVTIATSEIALHCVLLPILKQYHTLYPNVRIRVSNHTTPQAMDVLQNGLADLAVVTTPLNTVKSIHSTYLRNIQEVPVCSTAFSSLAATSLTLHQLAEYPIIGLSESTNSYKFFSSLFSDAGINFSPDIEASTADQILPLIQSDLGIGFIPVDFIKQSTHIENLITLQKDWKK